MIATQSTLTTIVTTMMTTMMRTIEAQSSAGRKSDSEAALRTRSPPTASVRKLDKTSVLSSGSRSAGTEHQKNPTLEQGPTCGSTCLVERTMKREPNLLENVMPLLDLCSVATATAASTNTCATIEHRFRCCCLVLHVVTTDEMNNL